jgi:methyltransferase (TIGR00027 family)
VKNPATQTALGPMVIVAVDQYENPPLVQDELAYQILPARGKVAVIAAKWLPLRRLLIGATERKIPGLWASMLCRKRYIEEQLQAADSQIDAAVILGAGFDTRAYRLPLLAATPVYELDLPTNIDRKRTRLTRLYGEVPANVTLVPIDLETQDLADVLADRGYRPEWPTFFVWEAVTQYLTEAGVRKTFDFLAAAAPGSRLVFTYVRKDFLDGTALYGGESAYQEFVVKRQLWHFGMDPDQVAEFLADYGWRETEQMGPQEFAHRYITPSGRALPVSEIERSVCASKI